MMNFSKKRNTKIAFQMFSCRQKKQTIGWHTAIHLKNHLQKKGTFHTLLLATSPVYSFVVSKNIKLLDNLITDQEMTAKHLLSLFCQICSWQQCYSCVKHFTELQKREEKAALDLAFDTRPISCMPKEVNKMTIPSWTKILHGTVEHGILVWQSWMTGIGQTEHYM